MPVDASRLYRDAMLNSRPIAAPEVKQFNMDKTMQAQPMKVADVLKYLVDNLAGGRIYLDDKVLIGNSADRAPAVCISRKPREVILEG